MDPAGILLQTPVFRDLSLPDVQELVPFAHEHDYDRGQIVWLEGDPADVLVVVAAGQLKAYRSSADGREVIMAVNAPGTVTGEVGLFHPDGVRWVNLAAMTPSRCLTIGRAPLVSFLARHPAAMQRMLEQLSTIAVHAAYLFSGVAFDDIARRVAKLLLRLVDEHGETTVDGVRLAVRFSQGDLAAQVAASRENVNRALAHLGAAGIVSQRDGSFVVHDRAALLAAATGGTGP